MSAARLPPGYVAVTQDGVTAFVWEGVASWLRPALAESETLYDWAAGRARESRAGRGPVHIVDAALRGPDAASLWAVRHYRRGGAAAPLLGDWYWGAGMRPERELAASAHLRAAGMRTPAVLAGAVYREGMRGAVGFYRADLVTEHVPSARTLAATLIQGGTDPVRALASAGGLARELARAGVLHPDLNAGNVLLDEGGEAWVLDLDRARRLRRASSSAGRRMLERLERSLRKLEHTHTRPLGPEEWGALRAALDSP